jgi:hypothetical protein
MNAGTAVTVRTLNGTETGRVASVNGRRVSLWMDDGTYYSTTVEHVRVR